MVPKGWQIKPFGELATLQRGFDLPLKKRRDGNVPIFSSSGQTGFHDEAKVAGPGVITGRNGTIGKVFFTEKDFWPLNTALYVKDFHGNNPEFVYRFLEFFDLERFAAGTGVRTLNRNLVHEMRVVVPPLTEQVKIVRLFKEVDETLQASQAVVDQTQILQRGLEYQLLTRGIGHTQFKTSELGEVPASWQIQPLGELCTLYNGHAFRTQDWSDSGLPIIRIQNLRGSRRFKLFAGQPRPAWIVEPGDLLFAWAGSKLGPYLWSGPRGVLNQHIHRVSPMRGIDPVWLLKTLERSTRRLQGLTRGFKDSLQHLRKNDLLEQLVAVPPPLEQRLLTQHCEHLEQVAEAERACLDRLVNLRSSLLQSLLSGRLRPGAKRRRRSPTNRT